MIRASRKLAWSTIRRYSNQPQHTPPVFPARNGLDSPPIDLSKTFSTIEAFSIQSMENVLHILEDAEAHPGSRKRVSPFFEALEKLDTRYLNHFTNQFGRQIYTYALLYHFNLKPFLATNPSLVAEFPHVLGRLQENVHHPQNNSFFLRNTELTLGKKLNYAQAIVRYFLINDVHCLQRLAVDVHRVCKDEIRYDSKFRNYKLALAKGIPSSSRYISHDPLEMRSSLGTSRSEKNILVFLPKDEASIKHITSLDPSLIIALMRCDEMEGQIAFEILCKRVFLKIQEVKVEGTTDQPKKQYWEEGLLGTSGSSAPFFPTFQEPNPTVAKSDIKQVTTRDVTEYMKLQREKGLLGKVPEAEVDIDYGVLNDRMLMDRMLEDQKSIRDFKVVVAHRSKIASRMAYSSIHRKAIAAGDRTVSVVHENDTEAIKDIMVSYFDRFFGKFYGLEPVKAEKWLVNVLLAWDSLPLIGPVQVQEAVEYYKALIVECEMQQNKQIWKEPAPKKKKENKPKKVTKNVAKVEVPRLQDIWADTREIISQTKAKDGLAG